MAFRKAIKSLICSSCIALNDYKQSNNALNLAQDKYVTKGSEGCDSLQPEFRLHPETVGYKFDKDWDPKNSNQSGTKWYMFITPYKYSYCTENFGPKGEKQFKDMTSKLELWLQNRTNANNLNVDIISADDRHSQQTAFRLLMHFNKGDDDAVRLTRDERLNDVIPHWTDPLRIEEGPNEKEYWKIVDMYNKYINRKINIRVHEETDNKNDQVVICVLGSILHRYFFTKIMQLPSSFWNRFFPPDIGSVSIVKVDCSGKVSAFQYADQMSKANFENVKDEKVQIDLESCEENCEHDENFDDCFVTLN